MPSTSSWQVSQKHQRLHEVDSSASSLSRRYIVLDCLGVRNFSKWIIRCIEDERIPTRVSSGGRKFSLCLNLRNSLSSRSWSSIWRPRYASCKFPPSLCTILTTFFHLLVSVPGAVISYLKKVLRKRVHFNSRLN